MLATVTWAQNLRSRGVEPPSCRLGLVAALLLQYVMQVTGPTLGSKPLVGGVA